MVVPPGVLVLVVVVVVVVVIVVRRGRRGRGLSGRRGHHGRQGVLVQVVGFSACSVRIFLVGEEGAFLLTRLALRDTVRCRVQDVTLRVSQAPPTPKPAMPVYRRCVSNGRKAFPSSAQVQYR